MKKLYILLLVTFFLWIACSPYPCSSYSHAETDEDRKLIPSLPAYQSSTAQYDATLVDGIWQCSKGFAYIIDAETGIPSCVSCNSREEVVSSFLSLNGSQFCVSCGVSNQLGNIEESRYDAALFQCVCPSDTLLVEKIESVVLSSQICVRCANGNCASCKHPYIATSSGVCVCKSGYKLLYDGSCVPEVVYDSFANKVTNTKLSSLALNRVNSNSPNVEITPRNLLENSIGSSILCRNGNSTACNRLANLCVVMMYRLEATPCALYRELQNTPTCEGRWCQSPIHLPLLYYDLRNNDVLLSANRIGRSKVENQLVFIVSAYDRNGAWKGFHRLYDKANLCQLPTLVLRSFFQFSKMRRVTCYLNWSHFSNAEDSEFYDVYLIDPTNESNWIPIPLYIDYSNKQIDLEKDQNIWIDRFKVALDETSPENGFRHRFYTYADDTKAERNDNRALSYITTIRSMSLILFTLNDADHSSGIPFFVIQYVSKDISNLEDQKERTFFASPLSDAYVSCCTVSVIQQTVFLCKGCSVNLAIRLATIVLFIVSVGTALIGTWAWMRRRQSYLFDAHLLFAFLMYLINHISNAYFVVVCLFSWYLYLVEKYHPCLRNLASEQAYLRTLLYVVLSTKALYLLYRLIKQCNTYYFLIDWERAKHQDRVEDSVAAVSMWRSTFVANKLNELQTLRYWKPLEVMAIVIVCLGGLREQDSLSNNLGGLTISNPSEAIHSRICRIAVDTFFWVVVTLLIYLLRFDIYYKFIAIHPLQVFVDLCSVSNISVIILTERMYGFYIHGESVHQHTDVSMSNFQNNLFLETEGNIRFRGLGGEREHQTFEVYISSYLRQYLDASYTELFLEVQSYGKGPFYVTDPSSCHFFNCISKLTRTSRVCVYSETVLSIKNKINLTLQITVQRAGRLVSRKFPFQRFFDFPPNIKRLNEAQNSERSVRDLLFFDDAMSYGRALMCGLDFDLFIFSTTFFSVMDFSLGNIYTSMIFTFIIEFIIGCYRKHEGMCNIASKTIMDDRLFI